MIDIFVNRYHHARYYITTHKRLIILSLILTCIIIIYIHQKYDPLHLHRREIPIRIASYGKGQDFVADQKINFHLFFVHKETGYVIEETREIPGYEDTVENAKIAISELIHRPPPNCVSAIPQESELRNIFLSPEGHLYIDFNDAIVLSHPGSVTSEEATIRVITKTIEKNFSPKVRSLHLLIEGKERETLKGHLSIEYPFWFFISEDTTIQ